MNPTEYDFMVRYLKEKSGLALAPNKEYLLQSRLGPIVREKGLADLSELIAKLRRGMDQALATDVMEAMTTNESFFFRDRTPFDLMKDFMVPSLLENGRALPKLRVWCAAASTGQEPYSISILLSEMARDLKGRSTEIVATDISKQVLERAKLGIYSQFEVQRGLPIKLLMKYFKKIDETWQINDAMRSSVKFEFANLLKDFSRLGKFDIVFCRNVLIYFDEPTKRDILKRIASVLNPGGFVVLGAAETIMGLSDSLQTVPGKRGIISLKDAKETPASRHSGSFAPRGAAAMNVING